MSLYKNNLTSYWIECLLAWSEINFHEPQDKSEVLNQIIWVNSHIHIGNKPVLWQDWFNKGIWFISDLVKSNGEFKTLEELADGTLSWINYNQICHSIPVMWKPWIKDDEPTHPVRNMLDQVKKSPAKLAYDKLIDNDSKLIKYANCWVLTEFIEEFDYEEYQKAFLNILVITKNNKYRDFQYRLLLGKLVFNCDLYQWGKITTQHCTFCQKAPENIKHLMYTCEKVKPILQFIYLLHDNINMTFKVCILNCIHQEINHVMNMIILIFKQYIYI